MRKKCLIQEVVQNLLTKNFPTDHLSISKVVQMMESFYEDSSQLKKSYVCISRGKKCSFFGKFDVLSCYLRFEIRPFVFLQTIFGNIALSQMFDRILDTPQLQVWYEVENFTNESLLQVKLNDDVIFFYFAKVMKSQFLWPTKYAPITS